MGCRGLGSERVCRRLDEAVGGMDAQQVSCAGVRGGHHVLFGNAPEQKAELGSSRPSRAAPVSEARRSVGIAPTSDPRRESEGCDGGSLGAELAVPIDCRLESPIECRVQLPIA